MKVHGQMSVTGIWVLMTDQDDGAVSPNRCGGFKKISDGNRLSLVRWRFDLLSCTLG